MFCIRGPCSVDVVGACVLIRGALIRQGATVSLSGVVYLDCLPSLTIPSLTIPSRRSFLTILPSCPEALPFNSQATFSALFEKLQVGLSVTPLKQEMLPRTTRCGDSSRLGRRRDAVLCKAVALVSDQRLWPKCRLDGGGA